MGRVAGDPGFANPMTTAEDIIKGAPAALPARFARGTNGQVLGVSSNVLTWVTPTVHMTNPLTTTGDMIYSSSGTTPRAARGGRDGFRARLGGDQHRPGVEHESDHSVRNEHGQPARGGHLVLGLYQHRHAGQYDGDDARELHPPRQRPDHEWAIGPDSVLGGYVGERQYEGDESHPGEPTPFSTPASPPTIRSPGTPM